MNVSGVPGSGTIGGAGVDGLLCAGSAFLVVAGVGCRCCC